MMYYVQDVCCWEVRRVWDRREDSSAGNSEVDRNVIYMIIAGRSRCRCSQHRSLGETISNYSSCRLLCSIAAVTAAAGAILDDFYMHKTRSWHDFFSCVNLVFESHNSFLRYKFSAGTKNFHRGGSTAKGAAQQHSSTAVVAAAGGAVQQQKRRRRKEVIH